MQSETTTDPQLKFVKIENGETIAYREAGEGSKVLVMVHGAFGSSAVFAHFFPSLTDQFRVIAPDLRGHGSSSYNTPMKSHDDTANDLKLFFDAIGLKKFYLLGWSMGGGVSMKFTANHPEYVEGLILHNSMGAQGVAYMKMVDGKPSTDRITTEEEMLAHPHPVFLATTITDKNIAMIKYLHENSIYAGGKGKPDEERLNSSINDWLNCRCGGRLAYLANIYNITNEHSGAVDGTNEISKIKCKTLILHGVNDKIVPVKEAERLKSLIEDSELKVFEESGHAMLEDYPEEFISLIKKFAS